MTKAGLAWRVALGVTLGLHWGTVPAWLRTLGAPTWIVYVYYAITIAAGIGVVVWVRRTERAIRDLHGGNSER
jgi:hypothetical protein